MMIATQHPTGRPSSEEDDELVIEGLDVVDDVALVVDDEYLEREDDELEYVDTPRSSHIFLRDCRLGL